MECHRLKFNIWTDHSLNLWVMWYVIIVLSSRYVQMLWILKYIMNVCVLLNCKVLWKFNVICRLLLLNHKCMPEEYTCSQTIFKKRHTRLQIWTTLRYTLGSKIRISIAKRERQKAMEWFKCVSVFNGIHQQSRFIVTHITYPNQTNAFTYKHFFYYCGDKFCRQCNKCVHQHCQCEWMRILLYISLKSLQAFECLIYIALHWNFEVFREKKNPSQRLSFNWRFLTLFILSFHCVFTFHLNFTDFFFQFFIHCWTFDANERKWKQIWYFVCTFFFL